MKLADKKLFFLHHLQPTSSSKEKVIIWIIADRIDFLCCVLSENIFFLARQIWLQHEKHSNFRM